MVLAVAVTACQTKDYNQVIAEAQASSVRHDSIFYGYYFGMPRMDFFQHSLELNSQGIMTNGPENNSILITLNDPKYKGAMDMNLYPDFANDKIWRMRVWFNYQSWAPWNRDYYADKCLTDAIRYLEKTFKTTFKQYKTEQNQPFWAAVEGNREIMMSLKNEQKIFVTITDLRVQAPVEPQPAIIDTSSLPAWERAKLKTR
jgi:hypothetical protein